MKNNILRSLLERDLTVIRVPWNYDIWKAKYKFDGLFISNGPGDPAVLGATAEVVKRLLKSKFRHLEFVSGFK